MGRWNGLVMWFIAPQAETVFFIIDRHALVQSCDREAHFFGQQVLKILGTRYR